MSAWARLMPTILAVTLAAVVTADVPQRRYGNSLATNRSHFGNFNGSARVTGVAPGVVKIIASSEGMSDTATVFVLSAPEPAFKSPVLFACFVILPCKEMVKAVYTKLRERPRTVVRGFRPPSSVPFNVLPFIVAVTILLSFTWTGLAPTVTIRKAH